MIVQENKPENRAREIISIHLSRLEAVDNYFTDAKDKFIDCISQVLRSR